MFKKYLLLVIFIFVITGCQPQSSLVELQGNTMGTYYVVKYLPLPEGVDQQTIQQAIARLLTNVNRQMSTYDKNSEISRFNALQVIDQDFPISEGFMNVIKEAQRIHTITDGGLDITIGPLVNLWGFGPDGTLVTQPPNSTTIKERLSWTGMINLSIHNSSISKKIPELYLDLSAIAKGYGVDVVGNYLEQQGIYNYLVDIGGEVRARGKNKTIPWHVAIEKPEASLSPKVQRIVELNNLSMATSGNYRNFFDYNGRRYSHTINPKTGWPINNNIVSMTVIDPSCMTADGLATGFFVMDPEDALKQANALNVAIYFLVSEHGQIKEYFSTPFAKLLNTQK